MKTTGEVLREKREALNMTAERLAEITNVTQSYVTMVENNNTRPSKAYLKNVKEILHINQIEEKLIEEYEGFRRLPEKYQAMLLKYSKLDKEKFIKLESRGKRQLSDLMDETVLMFDDENISLEDKEKMMLAIQEAFYDAKLKNKRKK